MYFYNSKMLLMNLGMSFINEEYYCRKHKY